MTRFSKTHPGRAAILFVVVLLAACAPRVTAERGVPHPDARIEPVHVATLRPLDATGQAFGMQRAQELKYFRADISVPPSHEIGKIEWPGKTADAATDFIVTNTDVLSGQDALVREVRRAYPGQQTLVFVHGYNNTLSDSMYRLAQIRADFDLAMPSVLFSWPSAGDARGYVYDRDSVLYARDEFLSVLDALVAAPGERVFILAHSLGSQLVMESLRQAAIRGDHTLLNRISGVVLMSPDIDPELFRKQAEAIGRLPQPFMIFTTRQDRALSIAGWLTGRKVRLGVIDGPDKVKGLQVKVVDFTALADGEGYNHFVPVTAPAAVNLLRDMISQAGAGADGFDDYMVLTPEAAQ